ncbi:MAG TPA: hypothetical protein VF433_03235, partial [Cellvibrio sp.]
RANPVILRGIVIPQKARVGRSMLVLSALELVEFPRKLIVITDAGSYHSSLLYLLSSLSQ